MALRSAMRSTALISLVIHASFSLPVNGLPGKWPLFSAVPLLLLSRPALAELGTIPLMSLPSRCRFKL